jgi:hypothetical protein
MIVWLPVLLIAAAAKVFISISSHRKMEVSAVLYVFSSRLVTCLRCSACTAKLGSYVQLTHNHRQYSSE